MRFQVKAVKSGAGTVLSPLLDARTPATPPNEQAQAQGYIVGVSRCGSAVVAAIGTARFRWCCSRRSCSR
jgi:hypothetical protein